MRLICLTYIFFIYSSSFLPAENKYLLITGCGRSGTTYISQILMASGMDIPHEKFGRDGCASWLMCVEDSTTPYGPGRKGIQFDHIIHQVRNPLKVISSVYYSFSPNSWNYILNHIPEIAPSDAKLAKAAKYWYYWNLKAESISEWTYQIENVEGLTKKFERNLGIVIESALFTEIPTDTNSRTNVKHVFTWEEISCVLEPELLQKMRQLAKKYGY